MATDAPVVRIEPNPRWIRGVVAGATVVDSTHTRFVWEHRYFLAWYVPLADVAGDLVPN